MIFPSDRGLQEAPPKKRGEPREIACLSWSTSTGKTTPVLFKVVDDQGVIQSFDEISVTNTEKREYAGTISYEFECEINVHNFKISVILEYFPETLRWYLYQLR